MQRATRKRQPDHLYPRSLFGRSTFDCYLPVVARSQSKERNLSASDQSSRSFPFPQPRANHRPYAARAMCCGSGRRGPGDLRPNLVSPGGYGLEGTVVEVPANLATLHSGLRLPEIQVIVGGRNNSNKPVGAPLRPTDLMMRACLKFSLAQRLQASPF